MEEFKPILKTAPKSVAINIESELELNIDKTMEKQEDKLSVKGLSKMFNLLKKPEDKEEKETLCHDIDPMKEFYTKLERFRFQEEVGFERGFSIFPVFYHIYFCIKLMWECGMGPMPDHIKKKKEAEGKLQKQRKDLKKKDSSDDDSLFCTVTIYINKIKSSMLDSKCCIVPSL